MARLILTTLPMGEDLAGGGAVLNWTLPLTTHPAALHMLQQPPHGGAEGHLALIQYPGVKLALTLVRMQQHQQMLAKVLHFLRLPQTG